ncbi:septin-1 isoform X1 [Rousettus aegyptiacus]|uniref:septin-1 isoform X1 n=1 Tax=Rousettus aegyptiacus TaxID=9407 RepID=UPI00168D35A0|nr:septin-1 isoform X1 [Rousettus aegyptiacus]XP_036081189.1 septin-1 isoform X1 [Rousettus aegyptiacus]
MRQPVMGLQWGLGERCAKNRGTKLPVGVISKGTQVRTPGISGLGFPHLPGPVRTAQLPTQPAPLFAALNFLPYQRKWGERTGAATASGAMPLDQVILKALPAASSSLILSTPHQQDKEYVGFAALPNQLHRKSVKKGFDFTLMVAGESGLGKSTLINSLFLTNLYEDRQLPEASARLTQTLTIERRGVEIEEGGIKVKLTLVDTPGFGDSVDCSDCWLPVVRYIEEQFEQYLRDESGLNRKNIQDSRVHCCLYFISPFGRGLRPLDVAFLRAVHEKVNIIPVIGKADALMPKETQALKQKIRDQLKEEEINIYQFPDCDSDEDEDFKRQDAEMKESIPFAVVGSCEVVRDGGTRPVRGRRYSWGTVEVENPHHCDFLNLRRMLVQTHLQDLKEVTHDLLYEGYRARCLQSLARPGARDRASRSKLSRQSATEIPLPMLPLADTEKLIREKDEELRRMQEMLEKMQAQMQQSQVQGEQSDAL